MPANFFVFDNIVAILVNGVEEGFQFSLSRHLQSVLNLLVIDIDCIDSDGSRISGVAFAEGFPLIIDQVMICSVSLDCFDLIVGQIFKSGIFANEIIDVLDLLVRQILNELVVAQLKVSVLIMLEESLMIELELTLLLQPETILSLMVLPVHSAPHWPLADEALILAVIFEHESHS